MKTLYMHDEHFTTVCDVLRGALHAQRLTIDFLSEQCGADSERVKAEMARFKQLVSAEENFREDLSAWRRPKSHC